MEFIAPPVENVDGIYKEEQCACLCGMHALNNMIGQRAFDKYDFFPLRDPNGNFTLEELDDVMFKKRGKRLRLVFTGLEYPRKMDPTEELETFYTRVGEEAWRALSGRQTSFLVRSRTHFYALRKILSRGLKDLYYIDSCKANVYLFSRHHPSFLGKLLKNNDVFVME